MQHSNVEWKFQHILLGNGQFSIRVSDVIADLSVKEHSSSTDNRRYSQSSTSDEIPQHDQHRSTDYSMFNTFGVMDSRSSTYWTDISHLSGILPPHTERAVLQERTPLTLFPTEQTTTPFNPPPSPPCFSSASYATQPQVLPYHAPSQSATPPAPPESPTVPGHTFHPPNITNSYVAQRIVAAYAPTRPGENARGDEVDHIRTRPTTICSVRKTNHVRLPPATTLPISTLTSSDLAPCPPTTGPASGYLPQYILNLIKSKARDEFRQYFILQSPIRNPRQDAQFINKVAIRLANKHLPVA